MTRFIPHPTNEDGLAKLSGTIRNLKVTRAEGSFMLTKSDQAQMGWGAAKRTLEMHSNGGCWGGGGCCLLSKRQSFY